jgi:hypothetical protein
MIDETVVEPVPSSHVPVRVIMRFCLIVIVVVTSGALTFNLIGGIDSPISSKVRITVMNREPSVPNFHSNVSSSELSHSNVSSSEVSVCACDRAPSKNDLRPIVFPSDLPTSSVVTADFANFANVVGSLNVGNHMNDPLDLCPQPTGCSAPDWSLSVIIPCYKRISRFEEVTSAIAASSARIDRIIFVLNGSPDEQAFRNKFDAFKTNPDVLAKKIRIDIISSTLEVGFYFRFQVAQVLDTQFVAFIDDDQHVGPSFLLDCLKLLHIKKSLGVCGVRGATYKVGSSEWPSVLETTKDNQYNIFGSNGGSSNLDSLFSSYVMPASWVKLIFRERLWTLKTGEDLTIPYLLRKYAGVPGFAIPKPAGYEEEIYGGEQRSWKDSPYVSDVHDSKREGFIQPGEPRQDNFLRTEIIEQHRSRGDFFRWAAGEKLQKKLVVIGGLRQAEYVVKHLPHVLQPQTVDSNETCQKGVRFLKCSKNLVSSGFAIAIVADNSMDDGAATAENEILSVLGLDMNDRENYNSNAIHRFLNGWDYVRAPSFEFTFSDILLNLGGVLRGTSPREVIIINDGGPESAAAALTCRLGNVKHITIVGTEDGPPSFFQNFTGSMRRQ